MSDEKFLAWFKNDNKWFADNMEDMKHSLWIFDYDLNDIQCDHCGITSRQLGKFLQMRRLWNAFKAAYKIGEEKGDE